MNQAAKKHSPLTFDAYAHAVAAADVRAERIRQHVMFGRVDLPDGTGALLDRRILDDVRQRVEEDGHESFRSVLEEEVLEAFAEVDKEKLRAELVQVAAVTEAWIEKLDRDLEVERHAALAMKATK